MARRYGTFGLVAPHHLVSMVGLDALAARHRLTTFDACCLELALRRGLPLATLDAGLLAAMKTAGVARAVFPS